MENDKNGLIKEIISIGRKVNQDDKDIKEEIDDLILKLINFKNSILKKESSDRIVDRWVNLGFLYGLNDKAKLIISHAFNSAAHSLLYGDYTSNKLFDNSTLIETVIFPAIRVILLKNDNYNNYTVDTVNAITDNILKELIKYFEDNFENIKEKCALQNVDDVEAEFLHSFIDEYLKKHIGENLNQNNS